MGHTILIVDDDVQVGRSFERLVKGYFRRRQLSELQARCIYHESPLDAMVDAKALLERAEPGDVFHLFTDGNMPDMDGDKLVIEMVACLASVCTASC